MVREYSWAGWTTRPAAAFAKRWKPTASACDRHPDPALQGREPTNVCNRGTSGKGVQLELSRAVRKEMFASLSRDGRTHPTARFYSFVDALRNVLESPLSEAVAGSGGCG